MSESMYQKINKEKKSDWNGLSMENGSDFIKDELNNNDDLCEFIDSNVREKTEHFVCSTESKSIYSPKKLMTVDELIKNPIIKEEWLVDGLFARGDLYGLFAKPKIGKSELARIISSQLSCGLDVLGRRSKKCKVLYLVLEDKDAKVKEHFDLLKDQKINTNLYLYIDQTDPSESIELLKSLIKDVQPRFIVIDTLFRFTPVLDLNNYPDVIQKLTPIMKIARDKNICILALHHMNKVTTGSVFDAILGSTGVFATMDAAFVMQKKNGIRTLQSLGRCRDLTESELIYDTESRIYTIGGKVNSSSNSFKEKEAGIIRFFESNGNKMATKDEIMEHMQCKAKELSGVLNSMLNKGALRREEKGVKGNPYTYCLHKG